MPHIENYFFDIHFQKTNSQKKFPWKRLNPMTDSGPNRFPSDDDFLRIFLPMIDDEERRRLEELEEEKEEDLWDFEGQDLPDDEDNDEDP